MEITLKNIADGFAYLFDDIPRTRKPTPKRSKFYQAWMFEAMASDACRELFNAVDAQTQLELHGLERELCKYAWEHFSPDSNFYPAVPDEWYPYVRLIETLAYKPAVKVGNDRRARKRDKGKLTNAQQLLVAVIKTLHGYDSHDAPKESGGLGLSCRDCTPRSYSEIMEKTKGKVKSKSTVSEFFNWWFPKGGYETYTRICKKGNPQALAYEIARLSPGDLPSLSPPIPDGIADPKALPPGDGIND